MPSLIFAPTTDSNIAPPLLPPLTRTPPPPPPSLAGFHAPALAAREKSLRTTSTSLADRGSENIDLSLPLPFRFRFRFRFRFDDILAKGDSGGGGRKGSIFRYRNLDARTRTSAEIPFQHGRKEMLRYPHTTAAAPFTICPALSTHLLSRWSVPEDFHLWRTCGGGERVKKHGRSEFAKSKKRATTTTFRRKAVLVSDFWQWSSAFFSWSLGKMIATPPRICRMRSETQRTQSKRLNKKTGLFRFSW